MWPAMTTSHRTGVDDVTIHLLRHGESAWNARGILQGATPYVPLSVRGLEQSRRAADLLVGRSPTQVWTRDQLRGVLTAEIVAARAELPVRRSRLLREQGHGVWEGAPVAGRAALLANGHEHPDWAPAGGETPRRLHQRAELFLRLLVGLLRVVRDPVGDVVVTHGETLRALVAAARGAAVERMPATSVPNGTTCTVRAPVTAAAPEVEVWRGEPRTCAPGKESVG